MSGVGHFPRLREAKGTAHRKYRNGKGYVRYPTWLTKINATWLPPPQFHL